MALIHYYKMRDAEPIKDKLRGEKNHLAALSKVMVLHAKTVELAKEEEITLRGKEEVKKQLQDL